MAKRSIFRGFAAVFAFGMCITGFTGCSGKKSTERKNRDRSGFL